MSGLRITAQANAIMRATEFIGDGAARQYFDSLIAEIRRMERPGDVFALPDVNEAGAWNKAWKVYCAMEERERFTPIPISTDEQIMAERRGRLWRIYVDNLAYAQSMRSSGLWDNDALEYLGLRESDLGPATASGPDMRGDGRRMDWLEVSARLDQALALWKVTDRSKVSEFVRTQRLETQVAQLTERLATVENAKQQEKTA